MLILDNCKIHSGIEEAYASKGYVPMFLSPYSPQFQPVELAFSKVTSDNCGPGTKASPTPLIKAWQR